MSIPVFKFILIAVNLTPSVSHSVTGGYPLGVVWRELAPVAPVAAPVVHQLLHQLNRYISGVCTSCTS